MTVMAVMTLMTGMIGISKMTEMTRMTRMTKMTKMASMTRVMRKDMDEYYDQDDQGGWVDDECDKKSEIVQYFQGRLCDKIGLL